MGTYTSPIFNSTKKSRWDQIIWENVSTEWTNVSIAVRSCDDPDCDGESFSGSFTNSSAQALNVPDNRYIQYNVNFESEDLSYTPFLEEVIVGYTVD